MIRENIDTSGIQIKATAKDKIIFLLKCHKHLNVEDKLLQFSLFNILRQVCTMETIK